MIVTQDYGWSQIARQRHLGWPDGTEWAMTQARKAGVAGWEPFLASPQDADRVIALAKSCGLTMPSFFVAGTLHSEAGAAIARMTANAARAATLGGGRARCLPGLRGGGGKSGRAPAAPGAASCWPPGSWRGTSRPACAPAGSRRRSRGRRFWRFHTAPRA